MSRYVENDIHVKIGPGLKRQLEKLARANERSVSAEARLALRAWVHQHQ